MSTYEYETCAHCGARPRVRVTGELFAHDDPSTGERCETTPRKSRGRLPLAQGPVAQFSITVPASQLSRLDQLAAQRGVSRGHVVRAAITAYFDRRTPEIDPSIALSG